MDSDIKLSTLSELVETFEQHEYSKELIERFSHNFNPSYIKKFLEGTAEIIDKKKIKLRRKKALSRRIRRKVDLSEEFNLDKFLAEIQKNNQSIDPRITQALSSFDFKSENEDSDEEEIIIIHTDDLWPTESGYDLRRTAEEFGLEPCSFKLSFQFLFQHMRDLQSECFEFEMNSKIYAIEDYEGFEDYYYLMYNRGKILGAQSSALHVDYFCAFKVKDPAKLKIHWEDSH